MMRLPVNRRMGIHTVYPYELHNTVPGTLARARRGGVTRAGAMSSTRSDDAYDAVRDYRVIDIVDDEWARDVLPDDGARARELFFVSSPQPLRSRSRVEVLTVFDGVRAV